MTYLDLGGPPAAPLLHLAHANGFNGRTYRSLLAPLTRDFRVIAWDARGHGESTLPCDISMLDAWTVYSDDLAAFVQALGERLFLIGHSLGATTSLLAADAVPDLVAGLVLVDPMTAFEPTSAGAHLLLPVLGPRSLHLAAQARRRKVDFADLAAALASYAGRGAFSSWTAATTDDYVRGGTRRAEGDAGLTLACRPAWEAAGYVSETVDLTGVIGRLQVPTVLLHGTTEPLCSAETATHIGTLQPRVEIWCVEGASHFLPMERPDVLRAAALALVRPRKMRRAVGTRIFLWVFAPSIVAVIGHFVQTLPQ